VGQLLRKLRESALVSKMMVSGFRGLQRLGISVTPNHFYWPVPDIHDLESRVWPADSVPVGFDLGLERQVKLAEQLAARYRHEWTFPERAASPTEYHYNNGLFEAVDAEMAYCIVRALKPSRIIEVGGGFSTGILAAAVRANRAMDDVQGELITIEPFPSPDLKEITHLIPTRVQDVDLDLFLSLQDGDILFLDSSHVVSVGSDTVREFLEILPRLNPGVIVHVHDIFLPAEYPKNLAMRQRRFFSEQYLLQAFLTFNCKFQVLWAGSFMHLTHPDLLERAFASYSRESRWPGSFWMRRTTD